MEIYCVTDKKLEDFRLKVAITWLRGESVLKLIICQIVIIN